MLSNPVVFKRCLGVNNTDAEHRLVPSGRGYYLTDCSNVNINNTFDIETRDGYTRLDAKSYHSMKNIYGIVLGVVDGNFCRVYPDRSLQTDKLSMLDPSTVSFEWCYTQAGDRIRASNGFIVGDYKDGAWAELPATTQTYKQKFPACSSLCFYKGRIYGSLYNLIIFSDAMDWNVVDEREDTSYIERPSDTFLLDSVDDGIWASDGECVFFLKGDAPEEFQFDRKTAYPAIKGTAEKVRAVWLLNKTTHQPEFVDTAVIFTTTEGVCIGRNGGVLSNLTTDYYRMPTGLTKGCSLFKKGDINQYIASLT